LRIESKRFVEEETQRKRLGSLQNNPPAGLAIFGQRNQGGRATSNERTLHQMVHAMAEPRV
jgi:hypothetical protein